MPDYSKTIIYKLVNYDYPDLIYVGSTTNFTKRKQDHKKTAYNEKSKGYKLKLYQIIIKNGGWENWNMIKICDYPCVNKREAEKEEDKYMMELKANLNTNRAHRTQQEYYKENKDYYKEYHKQYSEDNKEKLQEYKKQYREDHKDYYKEYHKKYREENKELFEVMKKKYYQDNKAIVLEKQKVKIICKCSCKVNKSNLKKHETSKKHIDLMNNQSL
jgi:hypothetical protein